MTTQRGRAIMQDVDASLAAARSSMSRPRAGTAAAATYGQAERCAAQARWLVEIDDDDSALHHAARAAMHARAAEAAADRACRRAQEAERDRIEAEVERR